MSLSYVRQEDPYGCVIAVLAMITGKTYGDVKADFSHTSDGKESKPRDLTRSGIGHWDADSWLADHGYALARKYRFAYHAPDYGERNQWPPEPWADLHYCQVEINGSYCHAVLMLADGSVVDPQSTEPRRLSDYGKVNFVAAVVRPSEPRKP